MKVVKHWHKLIREVVDPLFLEIFKARLGEGLRHLV